MKRPYNIYAATTLACLGLASSAIISGAGEEDHGEMDEFLAEAVGLLPELSVVAPPATANAQVQTPSDKSRYGHWGPLLDWPFIPVTAANLPDGRVVTFASNQRTRFPVGPEFTYAGVWDPATGQHTEINNDNHDMFCAAPAMNTQGQPMFMVGRNSVRFSTYFDYENDRWVRIEDMNDGRWYGSSTTLPNGSIITASGNRGTGVNTVERYTEGLGWQRLFGVPWNTVSAKAFPSNFVAPDGRIFYAGPSGKMHWVDVQGSGQISATDAIFPGNRTTQSGGVTMIGEGKVLFAGGAVSGGGTTNIAHVVDFNSEAPVVTEVAPMNFSRRFHNALMLPDGKAIMIGGNTSGLFFSDNGTVYAPEMWDPETDSWTELADMAKPRNYHSVALILPDGRVFSGGGGLSSNSVTNHQDAQIFSPPYLFNPDGSDAVRPTISGAPGTSSPGQTIAVSGSTGISRFTMLRLTSTTHAFSSDVRFLEAPFTTTAPGQYRLDLHPNYNVLIPGYWMLFALDANDTPSISKTMKIAAPTPPDLTAPQDQHTIKGHLVSLQIAATDGDGDTLSYSATGLPPGIAIDPQTGLISGYPTSTGSSAVSVVVSDGSTTVAANFSWEVSQDTGLVAHWTFDEGSGTTAADRGGANADGVLRDGASWTSGVHGAAVSFDGIDDRIEIANRSALELGKDDSDFTVSFWMNLGEDNTGAYRTILHKGDSDSERTFTLEMRPNIRRIEYTISVATGPRVGRASNAEIPLNQWVHVALVKDADILSLFIDGIADSFATLPSASVSNDGKLYVGDDPWIGGTGSYLDELALYNRALASTEITFMADPSNQVLGANTPPQITNPGDQTDPLAPVNLAIAASDPDGDQLTFSATGLPPGLVIDADTGEIGGTATAPGTYSLVVSVSDGQQSVGTSFQWQVRDRIAARAIVPGPRQTDTSTPFGIEASGQNLSYEWSFGDGTAPVTSSADNLTHSYTQAGRYTVTVTVRDELGQAAQVSFYQSIYAPPTAGRPSVSQSIVYESRAAANDRIWNVNPDNDTVSVFDLATGDRLAEIAVGQAPRALAIAPAGEIWVTNKQSSTISRIDPSSLAVTSTIPLPRASMPHGIVFAPTGSRAYVALEATGQLIALRPLSGAVTAATAVGPNPRHLSVNHDASKVYVSRFITPPVTGESTANPLPSASEGGEIVVVDTAGMQVSNTIILHNSTRPDASDGARGLPNYLGPAAISPDGSTAWVASKQDNIQRGSGRDGNPLTHDNTVRSITSRIDLATETEDPTRRIDHDNAGIGSTSIFGRHGNLVFSALEGSRHVAITDVFNGIELKRFRVQRAPQGLALSPDGRTLYVHSFMSRKVSAHDVSEFVDGTGENVADLATYDAVSSEKLLPDVLLGKQQFYDAQDTRLALEEYISCAACHNDGAHDGRVWDLTGFGEGLRNTIDLRGRAGTSHGPLHWSANFDEVQDFEGQIRNLSGGGGLIAGSNPHPPLGAPNAGRSAELDALAAYVRSLATFPTSPLRDVDGSLSAAAQAGKAVFASANCASCHGGESFSDSAPGMLHDIGTLKPTSGSRLGGLLAGIDTPTLRGVASGAPYLHDGSAETLDQAIAAHSSAATLTTTEISQLVSYLRELDGSEPAPPTTTGQDEHEVDADTIALYHFNTDYKDSSSNRLDLTAAGGVTLSGENLGWMQAPSGKVARFNAIGDTLSVTIPDSLILPSSGVPLVIETRIFPRRYLGYSIDNLPIVALHQEWDSHLQLEDSKWGTNPAGPRYYASGGVLASAQQWATRVTPQAWHHVQISFDGDQTVELWINGVLVNSMALSPNIDRSNDWTLTIGNFDGDIDELLISRAMASAEPDTTEPSPLLTTPSTGVSGSFVVTATFDENVTGLTLGDLAISNGTASNLDGVGAAYSFTVTPSSAGSVAISLPAASAQDPAGNPSKASNTLAVNFSPPAGGGDTSMPTPQTIALYHFDDDFDDASPNALHLSATGGVTRTDTNLAWMQSPSGMVARFTNIGDTLSVNIPDSLLLPNAGAPISIETRIFPRAYLGYSIENLPIVALHQDWDAHLQLEDSKWGSNPRGPEIFASGAVLASAQRWTELATPNQWHRLQISYDGVGTVSAWIDGVALGAVSVAPNVGRSNDWTLTLGNFDGDIDELHIRAVAAPSGSTPITSVSAVVAAVNSYNASFGTGLTGPLSADSDQDGWADLLEVAHGSDAAADGLPGYHLRSIETGTGERSASISIPVLEPGEASTDGYRSTAFVYQISASTDLLTWEEPVTRIENPDSLPAPPPGYRFVTFRPAQATTSIFFRTTVTANE